MTVRSIILSMARAVDFAVLHSRAMRCSLFWINAFPHIPVSVLLETHRQAGFVLRRNPAAELKQSASG